MIPEDKKKELKEFIATLAQLPEESEVLLNVITQNEYLPIDIIENKFDRFFLGQYSFMNFQYQILSNKILGTIELNYLHPITGFWLTRTGVASIEIERKIVDVGNGNTKTFSLELSLPAVKSLAKVNAFREVGNLFGRSLNREVVDLALTENVAKSTELQKAMTEVEKIETLEEIQAKKMDLIDKYASILSEQDMRQLNTAITNRLMALMQV